LSSRSWYLLSLSSGLILTAVLSRNGTVALFSVPLLVYLAIALLRFPNRIALQADCRLEKSTSSDAGDVKMQLCLKNADHRLDFLTIDDPLPKSATTAEGNFKALIALDESQEKLFIHNFRLKRGHYFWDHFTIVVSDPLGVFEKNVEIASSQQIIVQPRLSQLRPIPLRPASTLHSTGLVPARLAGSGTDFWGVRHYQSGDSLRHINWQKTARHPGHFFTRQFEQEEIMDVAIILDTRFSIERNEGENNLFEKSISAAASLAEVFLREGNRVGLLVFGQQMRHLFPGYGKHQLNSILRTLTLVHPSPTLSLSNLETMQKRIFQNRSQVIMISTPFFEDLHAYTKMRASGHPVLLICPDSVEYSFRVSGDKHPEALLAKRAAQIERRLLLLKLSRLGVQVVDWPLTCLLYTSDAADEEDSVDLGGR